jgi:hypothetical protein
VNTVEAGIPRPSGRTEKRAGGRCPDEHHLAVEGHTQSLRPERANCPLFIGRAPPEPDQTIDLKAEIGSAGFWALSVFRPGVVLHGFDHVVVVVDDVEAATAFFLDLGLDREGGVRSRASGWTRSSASTTCARNLSS